MTLYESIGEKFIADAIREFYRRAFQDPMICHFFINSDFEHLVKQQVHFASAMLDGPKNYHGLSLREAHTRFQIRPPHFGRRQVIMRQVLEDMLLDPKLIEQWLEREDRLRPLILSGQKKA